MEGKELRAKIIELVDEQTETLERQTFGRLTDKEMCEYEARQESIRELKHQLGRVKRPVSH